MNRATSIKLAIAALLAAMMIAAIALRLASTHALHGSESGATAIAISGPTMGSTWMVRLSRLPAVTSAQQAQSAVQTVLDEIEREMSTYKPDSDLSRFNQSQSTDWFPVHEGVAQVVDTARQVSQATDGAFDVTVGPLVNLWGFGPEHPAGSFGTIPSEAMIQAARRHVGYRLLEVRLSPAALRKSDPQV